jgi:hypothetical protein
LESKEIASSTDPGDKYVGTAIQITYPSMRS